MSLLRRSLSDHYGRSGALGRQAVLRVSQLPARQLASVCRTCCRGGRSSRRGNEVLPLYRIPMKIEPRHLGCYANDRGRRHCLGLAGRLAVASLAVAGTFQTQADDSAAPASPPPFKKLRYDENYEYLRD